jgi:type III secretion protein Q
MTPFLHLPGNVTVRIARHSMPSGVLATLVAGDIILPQQAYFLANGEGSLRWGGKLARVRYRAPSELIIIDLEDSMDLPQLDTQDDSAATVLAAGDGQADALGLDSMPVTLDFEMGKAQLSLGELRTLAAGAIVLIKGGSPAALTIRSAGSLLGRGELVDVSGQLAIRVTQWGPHS